jgi:hypothetical protein
LNTWWSQVVVVADWEQTALQTPVVAVPVVSVLLQDSL